MVGSHTTINVRLHERSRALDGAERLLAAVRTGANGKALFIVAEGGMGKTAVLDHVAAMAAPAMRVVTGTASLAERDFPFALMEQIAEPSPGDGPLRASEVDPLERRASRHRAVRDQIRRWAALGPVAILLDDLHWADADSLATLGYLARRIERLPVAIIGALRPWPTAAASLTLALERDGFAATMPLPPLSAAATGALLGDLTGAAVGADVVARAGELTGGNPMLLHEAARVLRDDGALPQPGERDVGRLQQALLLTHAAGLPARAVACLEAAAVLGTRFRVGDLEATVGSSPDAFADCVDVLVDAGLLRETQPGWLQFGHELLAAAVMRDIPPGRRTRLHRRAFAVYADHHNPAAAVHAVAVPMTGERHAIEVVAAAADTALVEGAVETALRWYDAAVELAGSEPPLGLAVRRADAYFTAGHAPEALAHYVAVLSRIDDPATGRGVQIKAARSRAFTGDLDGALADYTWLRGELAEDSPVAVAALLEHAHVVWERDGPAAAVRLLDARPPTGAPTGPPTRARSALDPDPVAISRSYFLAQGGDPSGIDLLEQAALSAEQRINADPTIARATLNAITLYMSICGMVGRFDEALAFGDRAVSWLQAVGAWRATLPLRLTRLNILRARGEVQLLLSELDDIDEEFELDALIQPHLRILRAQALLWTGEVAEAERLRRAVADAPGAAAWFVATSLAMTLGQRLLLEGRSVEAADAYLEAERRVVALGIGAPTLPRWCAGAIEAHLAAGHLTDVERIVAWIGRCAPEVSSAWAELVALGGEAGVLAARGEDTLADDTYQRALAVGHDTPLERATVALRYGSWLRRTNQAKRSRPILADVLDFAERHGLDALAAPARAELSAAGGRRRRNNPATGLTAQELRVARLAVSGATTREIADELHLSPRTIETHLGHVYRKAAVRSKRELRARWDDLAPTLTPDP